MLNRLQYITQGATADLQEKDLREALEAGCQFVQLRYKNGTTKEMLFLAEKAKKWSDEYGAKLIINDSVEVAKEVDAAGVHLGLTDTSIHEARRILGATKIIGGTANSLEDVIQRIEEQCDYVGLGPYRFTTTKDKLSPILGLAGYERIHAELTNRKLTIPIYAIGGIELADIADLRSSGVYGIAVSSLISKANEKSKVVQRLVEKLNERDDVKNSR